MNGSAGSTIRCAVSRLWVLNFPETTERGSDGGSKRAIAHSKGETLKKNMFQTQTFKFKILNLNLNVKIIKFN